ncbi:ATP-dependent translocase ABCB1-like isoform X2 [Stegodyphus dumicola]|uniref:ATP-dependent translocase ABCB1-like isoform X2 n=1 Tax=Stegodyphus dumicola TaxID=202533 RepID=UPI0015AA0F00|nr:ATP-dependent translocase ABCB1-like isoform X2 [Stegodyphus dumicola]
MVSCFSIAAANQVFRIRCMFMESILKQDIGWFDTNKTGDFTSRISGDLNKIQDGIGEKVPMCISSMSSAFLNVGCGFYYGWKLALVTSSVIPLLTIGLTVVTKIQATVSKEELDAYGTAGAVAEEVLSGIRTVVAFGGERKEIQRYDNHLAKARKKGIIRSFLTAISEAIAWLGIFCGYALAFWYGARLILEETEKTNPEYSSGTLVIVLFTILSASMYSGYLSPYFEAFSLARGAAAKIFDVINRKSLIDSSSDCGLKPASLSGNITLKDVQFSYPARTVPVLKGLSLDVKSGQTVALVGASGCGKSTVVQLVLRFYDAVTGYVALDGYDVKQLNIGWLRDNIGLVGQEPILFSTTIAENIKLGKPGASDEEVIKAAKIANAHSFIEALPLQYNTLVGERGTQLSGGQKQRIAIARALIKNPKILLLDEATSALDTESEAVVQAALDEARLGRTTIIVAHRLSTIRNADKIVLIADGVVKEEGTHEELMEKKGSYYQLIVAQTKEPDEEEDDEDLEDICEDLPVLESQRNTNIEISLDERLSPKNENQMSHKNMCIGRQISAVSYYDRQSSEESGFERQISSASNKQEIPIVVFSLPPDQIPEKVNFFCLLYLLIAVTAFIFSFLETFMLSVAGERLTSRLRKLVFTNIITQDIAFFDHPKNSVGALCSRLTRDASNVQGATGARIATLLNAMSTFIACLIIGMLYNYKIGLVIFSFAPIMLAAFYLEGRVISDHLSIEDDAFEAASKVAVEAIEGIRTVASLHQEEMFYNKFRKELLEPHRKSRLKSHVRGLIYGFVQAIQAFAYAAGMYYGGILVVNGELSYSNLLKVLEGILVGLMMLGETFGFAPDYQKARIGAVRIFKILDLKPRIDAFSEQGVIMDNVNGCVNFEKVRFNYPSRPDIKILKGLNLEIEPGKTVALVGSSGCGKSTCIQLIERFYDAQHGRVIMDKEDVKDLKVSNLRSHAGLVSQEPVLFSYSIAENIAYGDNTREMDMNEVIEAARQANIHNFIVSLPQGYDTCLGERGTQLSGGQKQRVAIARALLRNPKILLLDEATSALDAESEKVVQEALDEARTGRTCLIIAHRLTTVQNADTILVLHKGKIIEKGTHQELLSKRGHYYKLQNSQAEILN